MIHYNTFTDTRYVVKQVQKWVTEANGDFWHLQLQRITDEGGDRQQMWCYVLMCEWTGSYTGMAITCILSVESQKGINKYSMMFCWEPEGCYQCKKSKAFSTEKTVKVLLGLSWWYTLESQNELLKGCSSIMFVRRVSWLR